MVVLAGSVDHTLAVAPYCPRVPAINSPPRLACAPAAPSPSPQEFMEALYDRIIHNEIKMKDEGLPGLGGAGAGAHQAAAASAGW